MKIIGCKIQNTNKCIYCNKCKRNIKKCKELMEQYDRIYIIGEYL